jgi:hypothetical protein
MVHGSDITACFAEDYAQARSRFLSACNRVGANVRAYANLARGPRAEELVTDVAWVGPKNAKTVPKVATEMALSVLAYNLTRVMNIVGVKPLIAAIGA